MTRTKKKKKKWTHLKGRARRSGRRKRDPSRSWRSWAYEAGTSDESEESEESEVELPGQAPGWWARGVIPAGWWGCRSCGYAVATRGACCAVCFQQERQEELGYCEECGRGLTADEAAGCSDGIDLCFACSSSWS